MWRTCKGFSLVELMVGLVLAGIISLMAFSLLFQQHSAWSRTLAQQQLLQEGALILALLKEDVQHAGYTVNGQSTAAVLAEVEVPSTRAANHSVLNLASYDVADCLGRKVNANHLEGPVINQYYVRAVKAEQPLQALFCRAFDGASWEEVELVRGVVLFQVRVGVWHVEQGEIQYVPPEEVPSNSLVKQVEIDLLLRHPTATLKHETEYYEHEDAWGKQWQFLAQGLYERFFLVAEVLNG
ncbi:MAG TPA: prepilin-type N-terminal cleavage/methylation domain-containing protein [Alcanivoracaceae bacterium]|nr:prepilin-type N-terminal cleavage/methylation domain-containing protein [Alcanivoracaceae bacterium]